MGLLVLGAGRKERQQARHRAPRVRACARARARARACARGAAAAVVLPAFRCRGRSGFATRPALAY